MREREKEREKIRKKKTRAFGKGRFLGGKRTRGNLAADRAGGGKQNRPTLCALETKR